MLNVLETTGTAAEGLTSFLSVATSVLQWVMTSCTSLFSWMMENPLLLTFIALGLIYAVIKIVRRFVRV